MRKFLLVVFAKPLDFTATVYYTEGELYVGKTTKGGFV